MNPPTVSVLMPAYNAARHLEQAVRSILGQGFDDLELLVIDDGSDDDTPALLRRLAEADPRLHALSRPNAGIVATRNQLLAMARGELLAVMDSDDVAEPGRIARQVDYLRNHPECVAVGSWVRFIDPRGKPILLGHVNPDDDEALQAEALAGSCPLCHPSVMMRAEAVRAVGGYREGFAPSEDMDLFLRLGDRGRLGNIQEPLLRYRLHDHSASQRQHALQRENFRRASDEACARRGIPPRFVDRPHWRPTDRASLSAFRLWIGWAAFGRGDRRMAFEYGLKALRATPREGGPWKLLACALVKPAPGLPDGVPGPVAGGVR
ncbi:glycosyltransferase family 2 protein [Tautonia plasticadhaerens]|uniref:Chondroitin synthase n=1 Tax=Tautonia plasticadhaerens TaxID=2527974 RepID=A0A518HFN2_9BACT|nr:glycosyltransferase [Tautonia plasticadhaerens]QDV39638.1 Chondroitin synthase [Tautonia plasticadhaerens]